MAHLQVFYLVIVVVMVNVVFGYSYHDNERVLFHEFDGWMDGGKINIINWAHQSNTTR